MRPERDPFNAFIDSPDVAVANAPSGPLAGLSLAVKDIFDVAGLPTGGGNPQKLGEAVAAASTAPAVQALLDAGARFAGKTQTEELAFSMLGQNVHFPWPVNPAAPGRITGGSSSGSVAAVAGGLADIGTGSDTGGSVRVPASFCGLLGLRTTHGAISLEGTLPLAPSFDTFGWFASDPEVYETVGEVLLGPPSPSNAQSKESGANEDVAYGSIAWRPLRLAALDALLLGAEEAAEYRRIASLAAETLGPAREASAPPSSIDELYWATRKLQAREAWDMHGAWIERPGREMGEAVRQRFAFGRNVSDEEVRIEAARRRDFTAWLADLLGNDGLIVLPTVPCAPPRSDSSQEEFSNFRETAIRLLCWSGLSGFPQITLPLGTVEGAPFGLSLLGPAGSDLALIRLGRRILELSEAGAQHWTR